MAESLQDLIPHIKSVYVLWTSVGPQTFVIWKMFLPPRNHDPKSLYPLTLLILFSHLSPAVSTSWSLNSHVLTSSRSFCDPSIYFQSIRFKNHPSVITGESWQSAFQLHMPFSRPVSACSLQQKWRTMSLHSGLRCGNIPVWKAWRTMCWEIEADQRFPAPGSTTR